MSITLVMPSNYLILLSPSLPAFNLSKHQGFFQWVCSSHQVAKVLESQLQHQSFQWTFRADFLLDWLVGSPCSPRDSQESSLIPQFKSINSSALSFLYSPTLISIHDYWKIIALTRWTFAGKVMTLLFNMLPRLVTAFLPRSKCILIFWAAVTICSDFGTQKDSHSFFKIYSLNSIFNRSLTWFYKIIHSGDPVYLGAHRK